MRLAGGWKRDAWRVMRASATGYRPLTTSVASQAARLKPLALPTTHHPSPATHKPGVLGALPHGRIDGHMPNRAAGEMIDQARGDPTSRVGVQALDDRGVAGRNRMQVGRR